MSGYVDIEIWHNRVNLPVLTAQFVTCVPGINVLTIHNGASAELEIHDLQMFNIGTPKLKFFGQIHQNGQFWQGTVIPNGGVWSLSYQFPVFRWLHEVLDLGHIVKPINYGIEPQKKR